MHTQNDVNIGRGWGRSFRVKFFLVAAGSVVLALVLSGVFAVYNFTRLGHDASAKIQQGLMNASHEYLSNYIRTVAERTRMTLEQAFSEVQMLADVMQTLTDNPDDASVLGSSLAEMSMFSSPLAGTVRSNETLWVQNTAPARSVVTIWQPLLNDNGTVKPDVQQAIEESAVLDLLLPTMKENGASKLYMYMVGPHQKSFLRLAPYCDMASEFDKNYPGSTSADFWDYFFPGIVACWKANAEVMSSEQLRRIITTTPPYLDAAGGGTIVSLFHPIWQAETNGVPGFAGAAAMDFSLEDIVDLVRDVKLAQSGFAFITQSKGDVLAINDHGEQIMGLNTQTSALGVNVQMREFSQSSQPNVQRLQMPTDDKIHSERLMLINDAGEEEPYILTMLRLPSVQLWECNENDEGTTTVRIRDEHWALGFVVPESEIYESLSAAQSEIRDTLRGILQSFVVVGIVSLFAAVLSALLLSKRMTQGLIALANAAHRLQDKDYSVRVSVQSKDEVGQLATAFNGMADEIQTYTTDLENIVHQRTSELELANEEVQLLNKRLKADNLRLGAELDVARQLQMMVLPKQSELDSADPELDLSGFMHPADEVGGDYYDVLKQHGLVKIGMGDVTGHGLESGVLMLMVQSIARSLLSMNAYDPIRFLILLNEVLYQNIQRIDTDKSLTLCFLDFQDGILTLSGQHEELIAGRRDGRIERYDTIDLGLPIGLVPDISPFVATEQIPFAPQDVVLLFTDGITEAENEEGEQFGIERLCDSLKTKLAGTAAQIQEGIVNDVKQFIGDHAILDDLTLLVIKRIR
ncbi:MAG: HAMP domain-containing protein [Spartobacteria bacterium]|nr:HAMP domain-containing protein [Spartobacteria bacterium]